MSRTKRTESNRYAIKRSSSINLGLWKIWIRNKYDYEKNPIGMKFPKGFFFFWKKIKLTPKEEPTDHRYSHGCVSTGGSTTCSIELRIES